MSISQYRQLRILTILLLFGVGSLRAQNGTVALRRLLNRRRQGAFNRPAGFEAHTQGQVGQSKRSSPLRHGLLDALKLKDVITASVVRLFRDGRPTYVPRFVMPVVVRMAIKAVLSRWARPDVAEEGSKGVTPLVADANPAPAVAFVALILRVVTALPHVRPRTVLSAARHAVRSRAKSTGLRIQASTAPRGAHRQQIALAERALPTHALAPPPRLAVQAWATVDHDQTPEGSSRQVNRCCHA